MSINILDDGREILEAPKDEFDIWMRKAYESRIREYGNALLCYSPTGYPYKIESHQHENPHSFASLSVTGTACSLNCEHCSGVLLRGMQPTMTPEALYERCSEIKQKGGEGVLISGGSDSRGHVPLLRFGPVFKRIKNDLGLRVVVHTGLVDSETAQMLGDTDIDAAMLDVIGDNEVAKTVYHIDDGPEKIKKSLDLLVSRGIPIAPHIMVGMNYGKLGGELEALKIAIDRDPAALVIIVLSPQRNTPMQGLNPPSPELVSRILTIARLGAEKTPLLLGCARPIGNHKIDTDLGAIKSGVNGIAYISQEGVNFAKEIGLKPVFMDVCCSLAHIHLD